MVLIFLLPESARYLVVKNKSQQQIGTILRRIPLPEATHFVLRETGQIKEKSSAGRHLLSALRTGHGDAVSDLLYGITDLLSADQLAAATDP